jgi:hypothetical protein
MTPPPKYRQSKPVGRQPPDVRFVARADDHEIALIVPPPTLAPQQSAEPFVRLRFISAHVEVVLTLAEVASLSHSVEQLWDYLRQEQARRAHHP